MNARAVASTCLSTPPSISARIVYWGSTMLLALLMFSGGLVDALQTPEALAVFAKLGYPAYFATILGWAKVGGAIAVLVPAPRSVREWAYAGFTIDVGSAILSLLAVGHPITSLALPFVALALVVVSYVTWRHRSDAQFRALN